MIILKRILQSAQVYQPFVGNMETGLPNTISGQVLRKDTTESCNPLGVSLISMVCTKKGHYHIAQYYTNVYFLTYRSRKFLEWHVTGWCHFQELAQKWHRGILHHATSSFPFLLSLQVWTGAGDGIPRWGGWPPKQAPWHPSLKLCLQCRKSKEPEDLFRVLLWQLKEVHSYRWTAFWKRKLGIINIRLKATWTLQFYPQQESICIT